MLCLKWFKSPPLEEVSTSDNKVSIMDMPDLVMRKILGYAGFLSIMKLRKVCHAFRNFIDDTKLDYGFNRVNFVVRPSLIRVLIFRSNPSYIDSTILNYADAIILNYAKYAKSSLVNWEVNGSDRVKFLKEENFLDVFSRDLIVILKNQRLVTMKLEIEEDDFEIVGSLFYLFYKNFLNRNFTSTINKKQWWWCCRRNEFKPFSEFVEHLRDVNDVHFLKPSVDQFYDSFKTVLKSSGKPIQIEELHIEVMDSRHFMDLACFIDIKHMKSLDIVRVTKKKSSFSMKSVAVPLGRFLHKSQLNIRIPTISMEDVLFLKMRLLTSPVFDYYTIYYDSLKDMDRLISVLGRFEIDTRNRKHWYYRIPDTKQLLDIRHDDCYFSFSFVRSEISDVPKNAIIY